MYRILDFTIKKGKEGKKRQREVLQGQAVGIPACSFKEVQEFKVILSYNGSLRSAWAK